MTVQPPKGATEASFQKQVMALATLFHWRCAHFNDSRRQVRPGVHVGDRDAAGVPDLLLVRERAIFAELKRDGGKPSKVQVEWLDALAKAGAETYLWRPSDLEEVQRVLSRRWRYLPRGNRATQKGREAEAPCLIETWGGKELTFAPASLWVGDGRADEGKILEATGSVASGKGKAA